MPSKNKKSSAVVKALRLAHRSRNLHQSPLHLLMSEFPVDLCAVVKLQPMRLDTRWKPLVTVDIQDSKKMVIAQDAVAEVEEEISLYSDGSGLDGGIGGAAILRRGGRKEKALRFHLGTNKEYTVHEGELVGMLLAVELLRRERPVRSVSLALDSQAAIRAISSFQSAPGHYLTDIFHESLPQALGHHNLGNLKIRWASGHSGIPGNEEADKEAKRAAEGDASEPRFLPKSLRASKRKPRTLPLSRSALTQLNKRVFDSTPLSQTACHIDPSFPPKVSKSDGRPS